jgi:hypothetical protein
MMSKTDPAVSAAIPAALVLYFWASYQYEKYSRLDESNSLCKEGAKRSVEWCEAEIHQRTERKRR